MKRTVGLSFALISACGLALSACGGGGEDDTGLSFSLRDINGASAILETGGSPPDVSAAQARSQQATIVDRFNEGHMSARLEVDYEGEFRRQRALCEAGSCWEVPDIIRTSTFEPIMTKNGVRLAKSTHREAHNYDEGVDTTSGYGGWMDHSVFAVHVKIETYDAGTYINWVTGYGVALGDAAGTNPSTGTFEWNGVMVGRNSDIASTAVSNVVQGDAAITAELSGMGDMSVDVEFSNIKDLNSGGSIADMNWTDISVVDGSFYGGGIEGSFYGPQHEEVAGVFEQNNHVGAFGARR